MVDDNYEQNVRSVLARDAAMQNELAKERDANDRLRRNNDLLRQKLDHIATDYSMVKAERDHYMVQVQAWETKFDAFEKWFTQNAAMIVQWKQEVVQAPFQQRGEAVARLDDGKPIPKFLAEGPAAVN